MSDNSYDRYAKIRDLRGLTDYKVAKLGNIKGGTAPISNWKNGKYILKKDKMQSIANVLDVSLDYLNGDTDEIVCKECGYSYNPLDDFDCACHERAHKNILDAKEKYPFMIPYNETAKIIASSLIEIRKNTDNFLDDLENYIHADFSRYVYLNYENDFDFDYDTYRKSVVTAMINSGDIPNDRIEEMIKCFNIDEEYVNIDSATFARASKNDQLMRLLKYMEKLSPQALNSLEIQIKALAEQSNQE